MPLTPCPVCGVHAHPGDGCPGCGARRRGSPTAAALLLGLALAGCETSQPVYGVPVTDNVDTETGTDDTSAEDTGQ